MIPIGSPVTAVMPGGIKVDGFVLKVESYMKRPAYKVGWYMWYFENEVKIRYDNPVPFTLWQLNVFMGFSPNYTWHPAADLSTHNINFFRDHQYYYVS